IALSAGEFYSMALAAGHRPWRAGGLALALLLAAPAGLVAIWPWIGAGAGGAPPGLLGEAPLLLAGAGLLVTLVWSGLRRPPPGTDPLAPWVDVGLTLGGALYTGGILQYGLLLNQAPGEVWWILLVVLGTAAADSGAYFAGRAWGKRKLIPHISPNKTWAGFWGGLALCVLAVAAFAGPMHMAPWHVPLLGAAIGLSSVVGDLCESLLKRSFGAKDSGHLIPGHGGLLDRLDSIFFVLLVVYAYMRLIYIY
ncbi:MAG TPA: phosphatidate cytidylyltransferase, partial [Chloroflexia bacterium]|nr:phosphatidate cytidylyltransferase [Chloroflexia bacterium]